MTVVTFLNCTLFFNKQGAGIYEMQGAGIYKMLVCMSYMGDSVKRLHNMGLQNEFVQTAFY